MSIWFLKFLVAMMLDISHFFCFSVEIIRRCSHYRRRCKIRAPCCNEIFDCRHCHNEAKVCFFFFFFFSIKLCKTMDWWSFLLMVFMQNSLDVDPRLRHDIPRHDIEKVRFLLVFFVATFSELLPFVNQPSI